MNPSTQDTVAIIGAVAGAAALIISAIGAVYVQVQRNHDLLNGHMSEVLRQLAEQSSRSSK